MSVTQYSAANIQDMVVDAWSDIFMQECREDHLLAPLVNKDYEGQINEMGDEVKVSQLVAGTGQLLTLGVDADTFTTQALNSVTIGVKADKRAVSAYEFEDVAKFMTQLAKKDSEIRKMMSFEVGQQINDYLYSLVSPSIAAPDHLRTGITDFNAAELATDRKLAAQAKWLKDKGWYALLDPSYYSDVLNAQTLTSSDYGASDAPVISGQVALKRYGFNIFEDNSRAEDYGLLFHPDFMHLVMKSAPQFKVSDLHPLGKFGFKISVDVIFGARLGIDGDKKHIKVTA